jgi:hypothetical protein
MNIKFTETSSEKECKLITGIDNVDIYHPNNVLIEDVGTSQKTCYQTPL